jgi:hypothetical protein
MHIPTHLLSGWLVGCALPIGPRGRLCCMIAATAPDVDGLGIVFGQEAYWRFHHVAGHNVFFGLLLAAALTAWTGQRRVIAFAGNVVCFHLHLLMDYFGSGPGWAIHYLCPLDRHGWKTDAAWELSSWQNRVAFVLLLLATLAIAWRRRITPLERLAPRLDAKWAGRNLPIAQSDPK